MAEFFRTDVVTYDIGQLIDDAWIENRTLVLPGIEPHLNDDYDSDDYDSDDIIARVENAIENAIAYHNRIERRRNENDLGLERMFLDESELEYAQMLRDDDLNQLIELSVYDNTGILIWYTNGHFGFI